MSSYIDGLKRSRQSLPGIIIVFIIVFRISLFSSYFSIYYYIGLITYSIIILLVELRSGQLRFSQIGLLFISISFFSLVYNDLKEGLNPIIHSWEKFLGFLMLMIIFGPLLKSPTSISFKLKLFNIFKGFILIFTLLSFLVFILGLKLDKTTGSGFSGIANDSMTLAPLAAISSLFCLEKLLNIERKLQFNGVFYTLMLTASIVTTLLSASRGAIIAMCFSLLSFVILKNKQNIKGAIKYILIIITFLFLIIYFNPHSIMSNLTTKMKAREEIENVTSGRDKMWEDRINDFYSSPIFGVGFLQMRETSNSKIDFETGNTESGSGWLTLLASTGIIGTLIFIKMIIGPILFIWRRNIMQYSILVAIAVFFSIHTLIEGYTLSFGNPLSVFMWLNIAIMQIVMTNKQIISYELYPNSRIKKN